MNRPIPGAGMTVLVDVHWVLALGFGWTIWRRNSPPRRAAGPSSLPGHDHLDPSKQIAGRLP